MKAVLATGHGVEVADVPEPVPGPGQVLAAPLATGICGSDLHLIDLYGGLGDGVPPIVLGHEFVAELLEPVDGFAAGTRVVSVPYADGPGGPEGLGLSTVMSGGFAERIVLQNSLLVPVPDALSTEHAALTEPLAVGVHAVRTGRVEPGDVALVIGCGPIGLAVIATLKAEGHGPVVAADFSPARRRLAEQLGADVVLDPAVDSPYERWGSLGVVEEPPSPLLTTDRPGRVVAFECVGVPGVLDAVIGGVPRHSRIVVVGVCLKPDPITPATAITKEVTLSFVYAYRQAEFRYALELLASGRVDGARFVTGQVDLDGVPGAVAALATPGTHVKILVR